MRHSLFLPVLILLIASLAQIHAQKGPFNPEDWPLSKAADKKVHYVSVDSAFAPVSRTWLADALIIVPGSDQATQPIVIGGHTGLKVTGLYLNVADKMFQEWADDKTIDILMQVYGDAAVLDAQGHPRGFGFLTGVGPELNFPFGGSLPIEAKNKKWNWVLFRITNGTRPSDGSHYVGSVPVNAQGGNPFGGVNGGTIRAQDVQGLIVRVVAFGEQGAFGEPDQVNVFAPGETCDPEPATNLVFADIAAGITNHLIIPDSGQAVVYRDKVGPSGDQRRAVQAAGHLMNVAIADNFLGKPCNDSRAMKICVEFYDDPGIAGAVFGPESYATDDQGDTATYPFEKRHTLQGTGKWVRRAFVIPAVNLAGVGTAPLTGGPRLSFAGGNPFISRIDMGVFRTGTNALAGIDPLPDCYEDLKICTDAYGNYAELDLAKGIRNGLVIGTSYNDGVMIQAAAGPANDRRLGVRPTFQDGNPGSPGYLNFAIMGEALGPSSQPNAHLAICVTYYDDPDLVGAVFLPERYQSDRGGLTTIVFTDRVIAVRLEGTGKWRDAYFEIPDIKFGGLNPGAQAATGFFLNNKIFFSRVRYAVIRPCGPKAGVNLLADCKSAVELDRYSYTTNNGTLTLKRYTCSGGLVTIPSTFNGLPVTSIGDGAFNYCSSLTGITIPDSVTSIGSQAFSSCISLTNLTLPNGLTSIGDGAFSGCTGLTSLTIPNSVTRIGNSAFQGCIRLTSATIPNSVTNIGDYTFSNCNSLANLTIPNSVTRIGGGMFFGCTSLTGVRIPNSVTNIADYAFYNCKRLTDLTIPNSVTSIGDAAFFSCTNLTSVTIPNSVTRIGNSTFQGCSSLISATIPNSVTSIGGGAFASCKSLTSIVIPNSVTSIESGPCDADADGDGVIDDEGCIFGVKGAFAGCTSLTSVTIPNSVTSIGDYAFYNCNSLTNLIIPGSVTSIGDGAFQGSTSLMAITVDEFNSSYSSVDGVLFDKSQTTLVKYPEGKIGSYTIPKSVISIGRAAFANCTGMTSVTIPPSVTSIGNQAFVNCTGLTGIQFEGDAPGLVWRWFIERPVLGAENATVYYLPGSTGWGTELGGRPTALWVLPNPVILNTAASLGVQTNGFSFVISWATNLSVVVEASPNLTNPGWTPLQTNTLINGSFSFSDPQWANYPSRFYRLRSQ